ncbi:MAG: IS110 family transposase [Spirochaetia bacterium]|nr:IS110 family transposase [Spirochaetia bacterium]
MFYAGIDIAKRNHEAAVIGKDGQALVESLSFPNSQAGCEKFCQVLERLSIPKQELIIGMEATGHYWLAIYAYLTEMSYTIHVINPIQSDAFRRMSIRQSKTDAIDALLIAQIMRFGRYSSTALSEENIVALRQLSRYRLALVDICGDSKRRVIALLDQVFPEYERLFSDVFGVSSRELLLRCQTPEDMLDISTEELAALLAKSSRGRFSEQKAEEIQAAAATTFGISYAREAFAFQIKQIIEQICFSEQQLEQLEAQIADILRRTNQVIATIPGIGETLGAVILSEIGDIHRFETPAKLVAFAGLDVRVNQSGEFTGTRNKMSKRGSPYLRRAIWLAASRAAFCDPTLSDYYQSLRTRGKHHLTAIGAVSRKMCNILFVILRENRPYEPLPPKPDIHQLSEPEPPSVTK